MAALAYPSLLTQASWERQAGAVAKARTVTLGAELKALEKCWKAVDFAAVEVAKLAKVADVQACIGKLEGDFAKLVRAAFDQTRGVQDAAAKVEAQYRKDAGAKAALQAAAAVARAAAEQREALMRSYLEARDVATMRLEELEGDALKAAKKVEPPSPERRRLTARVKDQFRIVKNRPDVKVEYLLCIGRESAAAYLGPTASDSQRPLLTKALKGDSGLKFYRGTCIWEDGGYTFVGPRMSTTLARRIQDGIMDLTGTRYRVRAHEPE